MYSIELSSKLFANIICSGQNIAEILLKLVLNTNQSTMKNSMFFGHILPLFFCLKQF
jgi:hypothetical protein